MSVPQLVTASLAATLLLLHPACGGGGGNSDDNDGGSGDGGPLDDRVVGSVKISHVGENMVRELPLDLTKAEIEAMVVTSNGTTTRFPGTGDVNGNYVVFDVPEEPYLLRIGSTYVLTEKRRLDLGVSILGRDDAGDIEVHTPVTLDLTGLQPWVDGDVIEVFAPNSGLSYLGALEGQDPSPGETEVNAFIDLLLAQSPRAVSSTAGDTVYITQVASRTVGSSVLHEVARTVRVEDGVEIESGSAGVIAGNLTALAATSTVDLSWDADAYSNMLGAMGPLPPTSISQTARRVATPADPSRGILAAYPTLVAATIGGSGTVVLSLMYESPFPSHWSELEIDELVAAVDLVPGGEYFASAKATAVSFPGRFSDGAAPIIGAVESVAVAGLDSSTQQAGVGLTPTITWTPPTTGLADGYRVELRQLDPGPALLGVFHTTGTTLILPDGLLEADGLYYLDVRALSAPGADLGGAPLRGTVPSAFAERVTAPFAP